VNLIKPYVVRNVTNIFLLCYPDKQLIQDTSATK